MRRPILAVFGVVAAGSMTAVLAHYVWGQVTYIHGQLTPAPKVAAEARMMPEWSAHEPRLRPLVERPSDVLHSEFSQAKN